MESQVGKGGGSMAGVDFEKEEEDIVVKEDVSGRSKTVEEVEVGTGVDTTSMLVDTHVGGAVATWRLCETTTAAASSVPPTLRKDNLDLNLMGDSTCEKASVAERLQNKANTATVHSRVLLGGYAAVATPGELLCCRSDRIRFMVLCKGLQRKEVNTE
jgi:hypothetical protein